MYVGHLIKNQTCNEARKMSHNEENNQSIEVDCEMAQKMQLVGKDIEEVILNIFYILKKVEEIMSMVKIDMHAKNTQIKILEIKYIMYHIKYILSGINSILNIEDKKTNELRCSRKKKSKKKNTVRKKCVENQ